MAVDAYIHIEGLDGFLADLNLLDKDTKKAERIYKQKAAQNIVKRAKQLARSVGRQQARASKDVRVAGVGVVTYGGGLEWAMGAEFGSYQFRQFPVWRGNKEDAGYFFWPAVRAFRDNDMLNEWDKEVWKTIKDRFTG